MIERRRSRIQGWGVFATQPITKNTRIIDYAGEKIGNRESLKREVRYLKAGHIWCFKLNRLYARDAAVGGNVARYINHACAPNCYTQVIGDTIWIRAARNIRRGRGADVRLFAPTASARFDAAAVQAAPSCSETGERLEPSRCRSSISTALRPRPSRRRPRCFAHGWPSAASTVHAPDLNEPDFSTLTVTRMVQQARGIDRAACARAGRPHRVEPREGSWPCRPPSRMPAAIDRLVLLAPALDFGGERMRDLGDRGIDDWRRTDRLDVFHYGYGRMMPLHFEFYADAQRYDAMNARVEMPILIFQGTRDTAVGSADGGGVGQGPAERRACTSSTTIISSPPASTTSGRRARPSFWTRADLPAEAGSHAIEPA